MHETSDFSSTGSTGHEIAVIGMAGRFPGAANIAEFWQHLLDGDETIRHWTREELLAEAPERTDAADFVPSAAPLERADHFDAAFFGFSPAEAEILDPQQRTFLECAWHALETSGYTGSRYRGAIGVYAAAGINTYLLNLYDNARIRETVSPYELFVSNDKDFLASRTAFKLDLRGPAVTVQTACSSSLVAVHMAVQSLLAGECDMALAGGVSLSWASGYRAREGGILSPDGRCRAFDAQSAGTVPGSGAGIVVLKRLEDALADGDTVDAVILGSAINNDGALKASFTAPQVDSQAAVIADAQAAAGIGADSIGYIEAHGTGTSLGDPIEVAALTQAFRETTEKTGFCALGSVKTNIGHLDTAAGIAGFIKAVLAVKHGKIPASLHFDTPNPQIDFDAGPFFVNAALRDWPDGGTPRRAGVSSFGIGGTNAHVVLQNAPATALPADDRSARLLVFSARGKDALQRSRDALATCFEADDAPALRDAAHTLLEGRRSFDHRQWVVARDARSAAAQLRDLGDFGKTAAGEPPDPVFLFPGQGSQYPAMGKALHAGLPVFREHFDICADGLSALMGIDFRSCLFEGGEDIHDTGFTQPALFAVEYALARALMSFGIAPRALHGHSLGEYVAACLAGVFDLDTALMLVSERGRLMQAAEPGAMLAVIHPGSGIDEWLAGSLVLAAANAPGLSVVSGPSDEIADLQARLKEQRIASRRLRTSHAFHSPMMSEAATVFRKTLEPVCFDAPRIPVISNVTGTWLKAEQATDPNYWVQQLLSPVQFEKGTQTLSKLPNPLFVEAGPGSALKSLVDATTGTGSEVLSALADDGPADETVRFLSAAGRFWQLGGDLHSPETAGEARRIPLPVQPFECERYWVGPAVPARGASNVAAAAQSGEGGRLYRTVWHRAAPITGNSPRLRGHFLIFDDGVMGERLSNEVERAGGQSHRVLAGTGFGEAGYRCFSVDGQSPDDHAKLFDALEETGAELEHIVFLWPLGPETRTRAEEDCARSLLALVQAAASRKQTLTLIVVTQNAADVTGVETLDEQQALMSGLLRTISQEYPQISCRRIDIEAAHLAHPAGLARRLVDDLSGSEPQVAHRGSHRWHSGLETFDLQEATHRPKLRHNGVYAIVGNITEGTGRFWIDGLSRLPGVKLALVHDTGAPAFVPGTGSICLDYHIDCTDPAVLEEALASIASELGTIDGVFLSSAQSDDASAALIPDLDDGHWSRNIRSKIAPVRALADVLSRRKAGFCCVQSSLSTSVGGLGLAAYAGAYHAVELLAVSENRKGTIPWFAIGYPLIEEAATRETPSESPRNAFAVSADDAWELTRRIVENGHSGPAALSGGAIQPAPAPANENDRQEDPDEGRTRPDLSIPYQAPRNPVETTVIGIFEEMLGIEGLGVNDGFYELGGHSLLAIRVVAKLRDTFPVDVKMRDLLYENPTAAAIAETLSARMSEQSGPASMADLLDEIGDLSDEEVSRQLTGGGAR